jgi:hypothetical protein
LYAARLQAPVPGSLAETLGELVLLFLLVVPTGLVLIRVIERLLRRSFPFTAVERVVLAFYGTGAACFLIASLSVPIYGVVLVATLLAAGTGVYALLLWRKRAAALGVLVGAARQPAVVAIGVATFALLLWETFPVWTHPFPNAWDGSATALWTQLIVQNRMIPSSLEPFATAPVIYPMGASVWMTLPVLLFGWSTVQTPVLLPPLFLSLTIPAAYAWGTRWWEGSVVSKQEVGLLFAGFFGLLANYPRFYTGGSYDFTFALPLLLVLIGFLPDWSRQTRFEWRSTIGWGLLCGVLTSLSLVAGEAAVVLLVAFTLTGRPLSAYRVLSQLARVGLVLLFEAGFTLRSLVAWALAGPTSYIPGSLYGGLNARLIMDELDPFVPWKAKLSPYPLVSLTVQLLLLGGLVLALTLVLIPKEETIEPEFSNFSRFILVGVIGTLMMTGALLLTALPGGVWGTLRGVTNLDESSVVFFLFLEVVAILPMMIAAVELTRRYGKSRPRDAHPTSKSHTTIGQSAHARSAVWTVALVLILVVPLALGSVTTIAEGPGSIQANVYKTSNVTVGDLAALMWVGAHLPACSTVLAAPGSAAQFLPEFASVRVALPMNPVPTNGSYLAAISELTEGVYNSGTREALLALDVTEVFVTGQTSVSYPPIDPSPMESSPDFSMLYSSGDALVFAFAPGGSATACPS